MLRKALTLGMVFILALSLLAVSMVTCFTYDAEAHGGGGHWRCTKDGLVRILHQHPGWPWTCTFIPDGHVTGE